VSSHEAGPESTLTATTYVYENLGNIELPIHQQKEALINAMNNNQVVIVIAPTGTGKSTQLPQYGLEAGFERVRMTQPRRRAAANVASRVEEELGGVFGEEHATELVSCQTGGGLTGLYSARTQIMTEGVLRIRDTYEPTNGDNEVWILDEAHEGSNEMWLLSGIAKQKLAANPDFTVVVMTATPNKYETIDYWTNELGVEPAVVELIGGTNFEIEHREESESTTAREAVKAAIDIHQNPDAHDGANTIQVFEAGKREIKDTIDAIVGQLPDNILQKTRILPNHAKLTPEAQQPVYDDFDGIKIIVQTNIGKTSMTVPRTRYVITSGTERMIELDEDGIPALIKVPSSQDCLIQEKGRAGRTSTGIFIHTRHKGEEFIPMDEREPHLQPEILRSNIDSIVMGLALRGQSIRDFDGNPAVPQATMERSIHRLKVLGALDSHEQLTKLGRRMGKYPAIPEHQRSLVEAEKYSEQIQLAMAAMVASAEVGGLRLFEPGSPAWEKLTDEKTSDLFAHLEMFIAIQNKQISLLTEQDIDINNVIRAEELYRKIARRAGIDNIPPLKIPSVQNRRILHECIIYGFANSAYLPEGEGMFRAVGGTLLKSRQIGNRSAVAKNTRNAVVGTPRDIEIERDGVRERKPIIESVTEVPIHELGKYIGHIAAWHPVGFRLRDGKFVQIRQQVIGNQVLGTREVKAEPSPQLRAAVIEHVRARPGKHLIELYQIKRELERLARRTNHPIPMLTNDAISDLIEEAALNEVTSPGHVDDNLRQIIADRQLSIDSFLSPEQRTKILVDAPDQIITEGYQLQLRYSRGKPIVKRYTIDIIEGLDQPPTLPDGRQIFFIHDNKRYTLQQLRNRLRFSGDI
jgi:hypothetical protein